MLDLTLIRHMPTRLNEARRYQGWTDEPLSPAGEDRARALAPTLRAMGIAPPEPSHPAEPAASATAGRLVTSDLVRARRTAELLFPGTEPVVDRRIREMGFGVYEGLTYEENRETHGDSFVAWTRDPRIHTPPGGESLEAFVSRIRRWLEELPGDGRVVAVTHSGVIRAVAAQMAAVSYPPGILGHFGPGTVVRTTLAGTPEARSP